MLYLSRLYRIFALTTVFSTASVAQSGTGILTGTVKDKANGALARARVRVTSLEMGVGQETSTNDDGIYRLGSLVSGTYRVEVEANGFEKLIREPIVVEVGQVVSLNLTVQLGEVSETVTVTEGAPLAESQSSSI